ncbi:hypothetical protein AMD01_22260 [Priestia koreensis]|uniref:Flagellar hook-length control protein-like C-terminal domain-containing protein n=1 Tax=Priestia koreensis TaxID=284581 RepID=A0A0M0KF42_9BACI|nr:hypothetical protein AMD01_22260 [Priestia koreensis]
MQIQPNFGNYGLPSGKGDPLIGVGDTVKVNIQKVLSDNEAIVSLNGQAVKITIDGDLKNQTNVYLKIRDIPAEGQWKGTIVEAPAEKSFPSNLLQNVLEGGTSKDVQQLLSTLKKAGYPINETTLRKVAVLLSQTNGTPKEKIEAIGMMLDKKYPLESRFFQPIMAALFGKETPKIMNPSVPLPELESLVADVIQQAELGKKERVTQQEEGSPAAPMSEKTSEGKDIHERMMSTKPKEEPVAFDQKDTPRSIKTETLPKAQSERLFLHTSKNEVEPTLSFTRAPATAVSKVPEPQRSFQQQPRAEQVIKQSAQRMKTASIEQSHGEEESKILEKESAPLMVRGEVIAPTKLANMRDPESADYFAPRDLTLQEPLETEVSNKGDETSETDSDLGEMKDQKPKTSAPQESLKIEVANTRDETQETSNDLGELMDLAPETMLDSTPKLSSETKNVIVTFISKELQEATKQFSSMKRSVEGSLQHIEQKLPSAPPEQAKKWLDTTIKKLDQTLIKSDFMLYADMKTEKNVLEASTLLQQAKKQISLGNTAEASKIVQQVKQLITSADYKPSQVKMVHLVQERLLTKNESHRPSLTQDSATPRQVYETLRKTGLQDERELWQRAVLKQGSAVQQSVKQALLSSTSEASGKAVTQAEQAVQHITGQQLLSKQDQGGNMQSLFFQLPVLLQAEAQDMKIFIQSQKNEGTIDWQNCSMYVEFETAKLGRMGILLTIQDRDATLTLKHDQPDLLEKATGLAEQMKKGLGYLGLRITSVQQQAFQSVDGDVTKEQSTSVRETKEGFDYLI